MNIGQPKAAAPATPGSGDDSAAELAKYAALEAAAEWFAVLRADDAGADERRDWQAWLAASPAHQAAWRRIESVNQRFGLLSGEAARSTLSTGRWQRRGAVRALLLLAAGAAGGGAVLGRDDTRTWLAGLNAGYRTAVGATDRIALDEGATAWLNTNSALDVDYTPALRRLHLFEGEVLVQSAPDTRTPARPLVVDLRHGRLRALGTRFAVHLTARGARLAVYEGAVRIEATGTRKEHVLAAGWQLNFGAGWIGQAMPCAETQVAWSRNRLVADRMRLDDFLAELSRYRRGHLGCAPDIAHLRLSGSYPLHDTESILAALEATLPVRVKHTLPWWVTVEPR